LPGAPDQAPGPPLPPRPRRCAAPPGRAGAPPAFGAPPPVAMQIPLRLVSLFWGTGLPNDCTTFERAMSAALSGVTNRLWQQQHRCEALYCLQSSCLLATLKVALGSQACNYILLESAAARTSLAGRRRTSRRTWPRGT
jgi:hypothetical protein